jgi:site-specific DNA recombinase
MSKSSRRDGGKRAIIYTRQSIAREESISIELQLKACKAYCKQHGYSVVKTITDPGISGLKFERRPGIRESIELVERNDADVIVVYRWSRLSRKRTHQAVILDRIESVGGRIESATEPVDATTAGGRFSREVLLAMAAYESDQKSEQWREAQARRIGMGLPAGGAPPLGYAHNGKGEAFVPDEFYGPVVIEMYDLYLRGLGPQGIAKALNDRGLVTPRGKAFNVASIIRALDSGLAAGYLLRHGERIKGAHEPLIDEATWQAYQIERQRRRPAPVKSRHPSWFLGGGLTVCGRCGGNLTVNSYTAVKSQALCSTYNGERTCQGVWISRVRLETLVGLWLGGQVEEWANHAEATADVEDQRARLVKEIDAERADEDRIREGLRAAQRLVTRGAMSEDDFVDRKREVDVELREIDERLSDLQARLDALDPDGDVYDRLARALPEDMPPEEWNALLRKLIRRIVVNKQTITIEPWTGEAQIYDRAAVAPRRPKREHEVTKDAKTGRFVKKAS